MQLGPWIRKRTQHPHQVIEGLEFAAIEPYLGIASGGLGKQAPAETFVQVEQRRISTRMGLAQLFPVAGTDGDGQGLAQALAEVFGFGDHQLVVGVQQPPLMGLHQPGR